jgi:cell division protein ZapA (FtsZ GTPase activity inhibitor)
MTDEEALYHLLDIAHDLEKTIKGLDYEIERAAHAIAEGPSSVGHALSVLQDRQNTQAGYMYELGQVEAKIEDIENRLRERAEQKQEQAAVQEWEHELPATAEDPLAWLELDKVEIQDERDETERARRHGAEERMMDEMEREDRELEEYPDMWER